MLVAAVVLLLCLRADAQADVILTIESKTIYAGTSDTIDVLAAKEAGDADWSVLLAQYSFLITPNPAAVGSLEFDAFQPDAEQSEGLYLFSAYQPTGNFSGLANGAFQYDGGDFTNDFADLGIIGGGNTLLARLNVTHILPLLTPLSAAGGSIYTVSLIGANTDFLDENLNSIPLIGQSGTITISGAAAVPEPSSLVIFAFGAGCFSVRQMRQRRRNAVDYLSSNATATQR